MGKFWTDALQGLLTEIAFWYRLALVIIAAALPAVGEVIDDMTTYHGQSIPWLHVLKIVWPFELIAITAYFAHRGLVQKALETPPPEKALAASAGETPSP